ncbi:MAG: hypothetical protein GX442_12595 [Candidatus Riflebacteria bacterium]|nr:hypothetical protein [Candidatus Riflebacteria bacterium]
MRKPTLNTVRVAGLALVVLVLLVATAARSADNFLDTIMGSEEGGLAASGSPAYPQTGPGDEGLQMKVDAAKVAAAQAAYVQAYSTYINLVTQGTGTSAAIEQALTAYLKAYRDYVAAVEGAANQEADERQTCSDNKTLLTNKVIEYNLSHAAMMDVLDQSKLGVSVSCPAGGVYSGTNLTASGTIVCTLHDADHATKICEEYKMAISAKVEAYNATHTVMMDTLDMKELGLSLVCPLNWVYVGTCLTGSGTVLCTGHDTEVAKERCAANRALITERVIEYNKTNAEMMDVLDLAKLGLFLACPFNGTYSGTSLTGSGTIRCSIHAP